MKLVLRTPRLAMGNPAPPSSPRSDCIRPGNCSGAANAVHSNAPHTCCWAAASPCIAGCRDCARSSKDGLTTHLRMSSSDSIFVVFPIDRFSRRYRSFCLKKVSVLQTVAQFLFCCCSPHSGSTNRIKEMPLGTWSFESQKDTANFFLFSAVRFKYARIGLVFRNSDW